LGPARIPFTGKHYTFHWFDLRALSAKSDPVLSSDLKRLPKVLKNSRFSFCGGPKAGGSAKSLSKTLVEK
jgi:hypothetical protein